MSEQPVSGTAPRTPPRVTPGAPVRRSIATFQHYADAERAVDTLSDQGFPVQRVAIVGRELELVEQVTGRLNYPKAALRGAGGGAVTGALIGWIFSLFAWINPLVTWPLLALYGLIFGTIVGAITGALFGLLAHALQRGRRDFASIKIVRPRCYDVMVDKAAADDALRMLGWETPGTR
ncbi:MAG TPA: general stress protein [Pseudonocardia sp.]|jgi:hypothetical protein|uniref:general stress protein n=1 Tax=Pseudonocardia sp. TaxID=60912 RepID=UPI002C01607E|nr:general stress protein [Pseudonocardia sp.]HTF55553.1 general stress protein [Pseudonocardia sp.]